MEYRLEQKHRQHAHDQEVKPLQAYGSQELARSHECFFGPNPSYHQARRRFALKLGAAHTPSPPADAATRVA